MSIANASPLVRDVITQENVADEGAAIYQSGGDYATLVNVLAVQNGGGAAVHIEAAPTHLWNLTVAHNEGHGIALVDTEATIERAIVVQNGGAGISATNSAEAELTESLVWNNTEGNVDGTLSESGTLTDDPLFVTGALHEYYLSQLAADDPADSPALDAGSILAEDLELDNHSTAATGLVDEGNVDLGFHALPVNPTAPPPADEGPDEQDAGAGPGPGPGTEPDAGAGEPGGDAAIGGDVDPGSDANGDCGSCTESPHEVPVPPTATLVLALMLLGYAWLRRHSRT